MVVLLCFWILGFSKAEIGQIDGQMDRWMGGLDGIKLDSYFAATNCLVKFTKLTNLLTLA